ncbi:MAG: hypothetical protein DI598_01475 [Pseudopedobacter saltans]|uniref:DNA mismatch repair proteins mutS family domain-containing protein n=1 Tax=Pseudopedobacter saltans TaxID=151895 RepID=A0A2W5H9H1_9SPHI|nr:MAG: hypothetical protein DI598_01475 [Pseudopedobacter saltans]
MVSQNFYLYEMKSPGDVYLENISTLKLEEAALAKRRSWMAWARFFIIVLIICWLYNQWHNGWAIGLGGVIVGIVLFLFLVAKDVNLKNRLSYVRELLAVNEKEIKGLNLQFSDWCPGSEYNSPTHPYVADLDIFGIHSLFQYVNRAESQGGRDVLADFLSNAASKEDILERQSAIQKLSGQTSWRQKFQAYGRMAAVGTEIQSDIALWLKQPISNQSFFWKIMIWLYPVITLVSAYLYLNDNISSGVFGLLLVVFILFSFSQTKKSNETFQILSRFYPKVSIVRHLISCLEEMKTDDSMALLNLKSELDLNDDKSASLALEKLGKLLGLFEARLNVFLFFFLNTFLLWDVRVSIGLQNWKQQYGYKMESWLQTIYKAEAYNSLATLSFNHQDWTFPEISDNYFTLEGQDIGHPLIARDKRVDNNFSLDGKGKIALITGSNMGGKSTFLRSLGVNMVLAYAGAPVCTKFFKVSLSKLMSSMRIADNLAESTSTFFAELKKIRAIIEAVKSGEKVFVLLDEILRGTNSLDRHSGSRALMMQLIRDKVVAVIATHDVELANLVTENPDAIFNYHFDVQVDKDDALYFDYKLKIGVCQQMNAAILMKQIGIEI